MIKHLLTIFCLLAVCFSLTGCLVAAVGAGAAGGVYAGNNYKVEKRHPADT